MHPPRLLLPLLCLSVAVSHLGAQDRSKQAKNKEDRNKEVKVSDIHLGKTLLGTLDEAPFEGRVVLLEFWGIQCAPCLELLPKIASLNAELSPFGLLVVGAHAQKGTSAKIVAVARSRGVNFPIVQYANVTNALEVKSIPHCLLFDHNGQCLYQGSPDGVEARLRAAVAASITEATGSSKLTGSVGGVLASLKRGMTPLQVLKRAIPLTRSPDKETASAAGRLVGALTQHARKHLEEAEKLQTSDVTQAHEIAAGLASTFKGTAVGTRASGLAAELKKSPKMAAELKARPQLEAIRKIDATLAARFGDMVDPKSPEFRKVNAAILRQLKQRLEGLKKSAQDTSALAQASEIARKYGVE